MNVDMSMELNMKMNVYLYVCTKEDHTSQPIMAGWSLLVLIVSLLCRRLPSPALCPP
jgi:hypothetical protein